MDYPRAAIVNEAVFLRQDALIGVDQKIGGVMPVFKILAYLFLQFSLFAGTSFAAADLARVLSVTQGVQSDLGGKVETLAVKMEVPIKAQIQSDATGKAQFMFPDDSTVNIAPNTRIALTEFVDEPEEENIVLDLAAGTARIITGEASRRNPAAFTVNTPQAIIGVRGTIVSIEVSGDTTRIYLTETSGKGVTVKNRDTGESIRMRYPGMLITVGPEGMDERKATPAEAKSFAMLLRGKRGQAGGTPRQAPRRALADASLAASGRLPFTTALAVSQMDQYNRQAIMKNAVLVADGGTAGKPGPVTPVPPVVPPVPDNPPAVPDVPVVPPVPDNPPINPDVPTPQPPVETYYVTLADLAGTWTGTFPVYFDKQPHDVTVNMTIPEQYISVSGPAGDYNTIDYKLSISPVLPVLRDGNIVNVPFPTTEARLVASDYAGANIGGEYIKVGLLQAEHEPKTGPEYSIVMGFISTNEAAFRGYWTEDADPSSYWSVPRMEVGWNDAYLPGDYLKPGPMYKQ